MAPKIVDSGPFVLTFDHQLVKFARNLNKIPIISKFECKKTIKTYQARVQKIRMYLCVRLNDNSFDISGQSEKGEVIIVEFMQVRHRYG